MLPDAPVDVPSSGVVPVSYTHLDVYKRQVQDLSYLHSRDITYAVFCQGPYDQSIRYHDFMGWDVPWYSAQSSLDALLVGRRIGMMHICLLYTSRCV